MTRGTDLVASCRFSTARLEVGNWRATLTQEARRQALTRDLADILTPAVTGFLPEPLRLRGDAQGVDAWVSARAAEAEVCLVRDGSTHRLLGLLILYVDDDGGGATRLRVGYLVAETSWGKGIATELLTGLVAWCRDQALKWDLLAGVEPDNRASVAVLSKAGFGLAEDLAAAGTHLYRLRVD